MRQLTAAFGYEEPPSVPRVVPLRELRLTQVHLVLTTRSAWLTVRSTVESLFSTGAPCRNGPCIGAEALVEHVQQSMGERGIYYDTMPYRDPRMEACERRLYFGDFVVLGRAASRLVDLEDDPDRPGHQRWAITRFGRSERNALALLWHVERLEWRERARAAVASPVRAATAGTDLRASVSSGGVEAFNPSSVDATNHDCRESLSCAEQWRLDEEFLSQNEGVLRTDGYVPVYDRDIKGSTGKTIHKKGG